jgi:hypothetical protein
MPSFPAGGVDTVILRAELAEQAVVKTVPGTDVVTVSGVPEGDAKGYHSPNPKWKETPPEQWGAGFQIPALRTVAGYIH